jgi:hypothetical protein
MGANAFSSPRTQRDSLRMSAQVEGSRLDSVRSCQTLRNSLTRKRSLVQIQYGPRHFFENLSRAKCPKGSQPPAVLLLKCWSEHHHVTV